MTTNRKNELIAQLASILSELIEVDSDNKVTEVSPNAVEMLTIKECTEAVKGLSEHTVRKLIKQGKLPYLRTGDGVKGKILINKVDLLAYFNGQATDTKTTNTIEHKHRFQHTPEKRKKFSLDKSLKVR